MKKAILFIRSSSERQEIESQLKETREYAESLKEFDDYVVIGDKGASAYKKSKKYMELIDDLKYIIEHDPEISAVVVWHLNRLSRSDKVAIEIKEYLIEKHIQLYVKEPQLKLFDDDGTVNSNAELIFNIFATLNKQQINELRKKSHRAKVRDAALHKFTGGRKKFGYKVVDKQVVPDENETPIINDIYNIYASGEYSYHSTADEINERYGTTFNFDNIKKFIHDTSYHDGVRYPPIVTKFQYDRCVEKRDKNWSKYKSMEKKHHRFANRLIRCPVCGKGYTANVESYRCIDIDGSRMVSISNMDGLLWVIASHLEGEKLLKSSAKDEYIQNKAVLEAKIEGVAQSLTRVEKKAERGKKLALEGLISIEEYKAILKEKEAAGAEIQLKVDNWKAEIADLDRLINENTIGMKRILEISGQISSMDELEMRKIVRRWVRRITFDDKGVFTVETLTRTYKAVYNRYGYESRWYTLSGKPLVVLPLVRDKDGAHLGKNRCKADDVVTTIAWLGGSLMV
jgi:DNA invertase Pin-like site-specific DNA recombinase